MSQHILIVEDEEQVRSCLKEVLSDAGFDITEVGDGDRAIKMLDSPPRFDLLLTDISMPGVADGNAVAAKAKQIYPGIPVVYASGRPDSLTNRVGRRDAFISKPYSLNDVVDLVRRLVSA